MEATEQYFPVVLFIMLYKVVTTLKFKSVDEIVMCDNSIEKYLEAFFCGVVYCSVNDGSHFWFCG